MLTGVTLKWSIPVHFNNFYTRLLDWDQHCENLPMQFTEILEVNRIFNIFLIFAQNLDCGYTLEPPRRGGSNQYTQPMFWSKNKTNMYIPPCPSFAIQKWGSRWYTLHGCYPDGQR